VSLRFGLMTLQNRPWPELEESWRRAEQLGFDSIWVADHLASGLQPERPWFEGWTTLAALAARTERVRIGTLVASITLRAPVLMAKQAVTIDHLSGGRLELGIGAAGSKLDHALLGEEPWDARERTERFREYVEALDGALRGHAGYAGEHYRVAEQQLSPQPVQQPRPRLTIAAWSARNIRLAAERGDAWNTMGGNGLDAEQGLARVREQSVLLDEACRELGRDPASIGRSLLLGKYWIADTPFASEAAFREFVAKYREAGIDEFLFYYPVEPFLPEGSVREGVFERVATEVIPELRAT
jgi:alkanesulfonate monooxygenase SsuD/methylene tetrahydromethanopterin reductase-like flavin-dependent oxidoreductase (luciferase family)